MKAKRVISFYFICFVMLSFMLFSPEKLAAKKKVVKVPLAFQEQSQWCWAACSNSILRYFKKTISQCSIANYAWSSDSCCKNPNPCNKGNYMYGKAGSLKGILDHWCVSSKKQKGSLPYWFLKKEIESKRPIIIRWEWANSKSGHFLIIRGYNHKKNAKKNPWKVGNQPNAKHNV